MRVFVVGEDLAISIGFFGLGLALLALVLLAVSPLGWRLGWWRFRFAFYRLMPASGFIGFAAALISVLALVIGGTRLGREGVSSAGLGLILGAALAYVPWRYYRTIKSVPLIHDISTDTENPPTYGAVLPAREAEQANSLIHEGHALATLQKAAYPDLAPLRVALPRADAFKRALDAANAMPGWTILAADSATGHIEASETSFWFGFTDDVAIRVAADGSESRIDMRSVSRQGRSDLGVNARRIRAYMTALKQRIV